MRQLPILRGYVPNLSLVLTVYVCSAIFVLILESV